MYTIRQAARRAGVGVSLLRAWEHRYGIVAPSRTPAGYRLYDDDAINRVRAMRRLIDDGWPTSQAAERIRSAGPVVMEPGATTPDLPAEPPADLGATVVPSLLASARAYDAAGIDRAMDELFGRASYEAVIDDLVLPAVAALGTAWTEGTLDIAGEHLATAAVLRRLAERFEHAATRGRGRPVIVGLPAGARHEVGTLAFAVALRRRGVDVLYLGQDVPAASWAVAARDRGAAVAVIGVPRPADVETGVAAVAAVHGSHPTIRVAVGGPAAGLAAEAVDATVPMRLVRLPDRVVDAAEAVASLVPQPTSPRQARA